MTRRTVRGDLTCAMMFAPVQLKVPLHQLDFLYYWRLLVRPADVSRAQYVVCSSSRRLVLFFFLKLQVKLGHLKILTRGGRCSLQQP